MKSTIDFVTQAQKFMNVYKDDAHSRFHSYDHVREFFKENLYRDTITDKDLALHLFVFLASWGMLRGSSFLLQKDYSFLEPVVEILRDQKYEFLMDIDVLAEEFDREKYIAAILEIQKRIDQKWKKSTNYWKYDNRAGDEIAKKINKASDTQIGKILLGAFGCLPAYDHNILLSMGEAGITQQLNDVSLRELLTYIDENKDEIQTAQKYIKEKSGKEYSIMRVVDMGFWRHGLDLDAIIQKAKSAKKNLKAAAATLE